MYIYYNYLWLHLTNFPFNLMLFTPLLCKRSSLQVSPINNLHLILIYPKSCVIISSLKIFTFQLQLTLSISFGRTAVDIYVTYGVTSPSDLVPPDAAVAAD